MMESLQFKSEIEKLYFYHRNQALTQNFSNIKQDRKSIVLYDFDAVKWIIRPKGVDNIELKDIASYHKHDSSRIMFRCSNKNTLITHEKKCRQLLDTDQAAFDEFLAACTEADKSEGMVSLSDPVVYGCFMKDKLLSVTSIWNWGNHLSDIGVLTHPDYRQNGYAESVIRTLMKDIDRIFIW